MIGHFVDRSDFEADTFDENKEQIENLAYIISNFQPYFLKLKLFLDPEKSQLQNKGWKCTKNWT